ncbi:MAG: hypothetical protein E5Y67_16385 [Mesorhizobium sp.]|nr:MAG: hypothetical protein E5Y67_16385 [Mesorhizobium sp.]
MSFLAAQFYVVGLVAYLAVENDRNLIENGERFRELRHSSIDLSDQAVEKFPDVFHRGSLRPGIEPGERTDRCLEVLALLCEVVFEFFVGGPVA